MNTGIVLEKAEGSTDSAASDSAAEIGDYQNMKKPAFIKPGDTIGLVAPSFGAATEPYSTRLASAIRKFEGRGYHVVTADSVYKSDGLGISTDPASAAADLVSFYLDDRIDAVIAVGGGELMNETISHVDFSALRDARPKWYMGYSDNTNMILPMAVIAEVPGIYGPNAAGFGKPWEATEEDAFMLLEGRKDTVSGFDLYELPFSPEGEEEEEEDPLAPYALTEPKILTSFLPHKGDLVKADPSETISASGMLLGGCLDILTNLGGTEFDRVPEYCSKYGSVIWVLEACDLTPMSIRRAVWTLLHRDWFKTASAFLIGRPLTAFRQEMMGVDSYNAVTDILKDLQVPIIMDCDIGHVSPMMPLIIGSRADLTVKGNDIRIRMTLD